MKAAKQNRRIREDALLTKAVQNELSIKQKTLSEMMVEVAEPLGDSFMSIEFTTAFPRTMLWEASIFFKSEMVIGSGPTPEAALEATTKEMG